MSSFARNLVVSQVLLQKHWFTEQELAMVWTKIRPDSDQLLEHHLDEVGQLDDHQRGEI